MQQLCAFVCSFVCPVFFYSELALQATMFIPSSAQRRRTTSDDGHKSQMFEWMTTSKASAFCETDVPEC